MKGESALRLAIGLAVGGILGFLTARIVFEDTPPLLVEAAGAAETSPVQTEPGSRERIGLSRAQAVSPTAAVEPERRDIAPGSNALISDALHEYAEEQIRQGWRSVREDSIPERNLKDALDRYVRLVLEMPDALGRREAELRTMNEVAVEDARTGGAHGLLETMTRGDAGPLPELVGDADAFGRLFPRDAKEIPLGASGHLRTLGRDTEDGMTWVFPVGVYEIGDLLREKSPFPRDVTLAGAGMDVTMLVLRSDLGARGPLRRFAIRDCTVFTNNNYLFDDRTGSGTVVMDGVRVIGFDMAAGASCALSFTDGVALYARNSRFEGGYGRSPGSGTVFRTTTFLARFENCFFSEVRLGLSRGGAATAVFANCQMIEILDNVEEGGGTVLDNTLVQRRDRAAGDLPKRNLEELFPDWKAQLQR